MGEIVISARGVAKTDRALSSLERDAQRGIADAVRRVARAHEKLLRSHSPSRRIARTIQARPDESRPGRVQQVIHIEAHDPATGFNILPITRFGHRRERIYPRADRGRATVISTGAPRGPEAQFKGQEKAQTALAFRDRSGKLIFRHYVKGYHPPSDWVEDAFREGKPVVQAEMTRLGRQILSGIR